MNAAFTSFSGWRRRVANGMGRAMNGGGKRSSQGAGAVIAGAIIIGVIAGVIARQPSIGFLAGTGAGVLMAVLLYLRDRKA